MRGVFRSARLWVPLLLAGLSGSASAQKDRPLTKDELQAMVQDEEEIPSEG